MKLLARGLLIIAPFFTAAAQPYVVSTYAGGGAPSEPTASLNGVGYGHGLAVAPNGNLYFPANGCIFMIDFHDPATKTRIAGTGVQGYLGDGGPALSARLSMAQGIAIGADGSIFVADYGNSRIRRITPDGIITTIAGGGSQSGEGVAATDAKVSAMSLGFDKAGNLFLAETGGVRKIAPSGIVTTVVRLGGGSKGIAVDSAGDLFIADAGSGSVLKVSPDGSRSTLAAGLDGPNAVVANSDGSSLVAEYGQRTGQPQVRTISPNGTLGAIGVSGFTGAHLASASDLALGDNLYVLDAQQGVVFTLFFVGFLHGTVGANPSASAGDGGPASSAYLANPVGVAMDPNGNLFLSDPTLNRIREVSRNGVITTIAGMGYASYGGDGGQARDAQLNAPWGMAFDTAGNLFVADRSNERVRKISPDGIIKTVAGTGDFGYSGDGRPAAKAQLWSPLGIAVDAADNLYIADSGNSVVRKVSPDGIITTVVGGEHDFLGDGDRATDVLLNQLTGVAVDGSGNLWIASHPLRKVSPSGIISTPLGDGSLRIDQGVVANGVVADSLGNVFITAADNVSKIGADGTLSTIAKFPSGAICCPAAARPAGITIDRSGNLYVGDLSNGVVRMLQPNHAASPVTGP